ncbi:hypothetical protein DIPPA_07452 [Diplonema papillatum]|nr:hypothetical protein DIPPA_07452 [Diplonema papillatum]
MWDISVATALVFGLTIVLDVTFRQVYSHEMIEGSPIFSWNVAAVFQSIVFPGLCVLSVAEKQFRGIWDIAHCSWDNKGDGTCGDMLFEELFCLAVVAYFARDCIVLCRDVSSNLRYFAHHFICGAATLFLFAFDASGGVTIVCVGIMGLEAGSFCMGRCLLNPSSATTYVYLCGMTISNFIAALVLPYILFFTSITDYRAWLIVATSTVLCAVRQLVCMQECARRFDDIQEAALAKPKVQ